ncbi:hypothetical protein VTK56DRAFT_8273 [Thermocarpiscus australiensis]
MNQGQQAEQRAYCSQKLLGQPTLRCVHERVLSQSTCVLYTTSQGSVTFRHNVQSRCVSLASNTPATFRLQFLDSLPTLDFWRDTAVTGIDGTNWRLSPYFKPAIEPLRSFYQIFCFLYESLDVVSSLKGAILISVYPWFLYPYIPYIAGPKRLQSRLRSRARRTA